MKYTTKKTKILKNLQDTRIKHNLTYYDMAKMLNISKTYYWQIENGNRRLSYEMAKKIATLLDSKPDEIFYYDI